MYSAEPQSHSSPARTDPIYRSLFCSLGFFRGAEIADPSGLLEGTGKFMRHVTLRPTDEDDLDTEALTQLIETAHADMQERLKSGCS